MPEVAGHWRRVVPLALLVLALVVGGLVAVAAVLPDPAEEFVTRSGSTFEVDGDEFRFVGFNLYDAAASDIYACEPRTRLDDDALDAAMRSVRDAGGTVVRFWAFQTYTGGGVDFSGVDRVLAAARDHDLRVMPVLEDGPGNCSTGAQSVPLSATDDDTWYAEGYREPLGDARLSYRDYVAQIAAHYRDEPTILGWSLVNEAETTMRTADDESVLVDFARDVSSVVRAADPHHLITLGTQSNGAPGASGSDFEAVYGLEGLDFTEVHDWGSWGSDTEAMPGATPEGGLPDLDECRRTDARIACSFTIARALDKPIVVGEAGIRADGPEDRARRADLLDAKIEAAFESGASGYLIWQLNTVDTDGYGVLVGGEDPLVDVLRSAAGRWATRE